MHVSIEEIHAAPTADGVDHVLLPGEGEAMQLRRSRSEGIALRADVVEKLTQAAELAGVRPVWLSAQSKTAIPRR